MSCSLPKIGLGVYKAGEAVERAVVFAVSAGYRLIDCAKVYGCEAEVGNAIRACGVPREELFVIDKLWPTDFDDPRRAFDESRKRMGLDYFDAYLLHWPGIDERRRLRAYEAVCELQRDGLVGMAGVSNFMPDHLDGLERASLPRPGCDQLEVHPWFPQTGVREACRRDGIPVIAWAPIFRGAGDREPVLLEMAERYRRTPAQLILRWHLQNGTIPIPKSVTPSRIRENIDVFDFELADADMAAIDALADGRHIGKDPYVYDG